MAKATPPRLWLILFALLLTGAVLAAEPPEVETAEDETESAEVPDSGQNLAEILQGQDGVRIQTMCTHCNSANIQVGGLSQDLVPLYRNGYPVLGGLATSMVLNILPADAVAEADVEKGPGSAEADGSAAGGTMRLIESTPLEVPRVEAAFETGSYDEFSTEMRLAGPIRRWVSGLFTVGTAKVDEVDDDDDGWNDVAAIERTYAEGQLYFDVGRNHDLDFGLSWIEEDDTFGRGKWDFIYGAANPDEPFPGWVREDTSFDRMEYRGGWEWSLGRGRKLELKVLDATRDQAVHAEETRGEEFLERFLIREENLWGGVTYRQPIGLQWMFSSGIEARRDRLFAKSLIPALGTHEPGTDLVKHSSAFAEIEWAPSHRWALQAGVRYDDATWQAIRLDPIIMEETRQSQSRDRSSPRFAARFKPADAWTLRLLAGATFRVPKPIMTEVCCGQEYQRSANTLAETGDTLGFEGIYQPSPDLRASLYIARTDFDNHIMRLVGWSLGFTQTYALANMAEARADTAEIAVRWSATHRLTVDGSIGWLSFKNQRDELITVAIESMGTTQEVYLPFERIPYLPLRTASLSANLSLPGGGTLTVGGAYTGEMLIQQFSATGVRPAPESPFPRNRLLNELRRTDDFWLVNLSAEIPLKHGMSLLLAANNLTDEIQSDLGDQMTDYNWGPLSGRSWRLGIVYRSN